MSDSPDSPKLQVQVQAQVQPQVQTIPQTIPQINSFIQSETGPGYVIDVNEITNEIQFTTDLSNVQI